ncbi:hypothetical protein [Niallia sp. 03133]|uniref:hypothetical protein n=1 Tax=Niallia sp. 03133 TaxID=3458060 RepID=UPI004044EF17
MEKDTVKKILEQLKSGEIEEVIIKKEEFLSFREHLVKREDFKHYRGVAERGGDVTYRYLQKPRS